MSKRKERPTCGNCRFWGERRDGDGYRRRYAPRPMPERLLTDRQGDVNRWPVFPITSAVDWCGEIEEASNNE